MLRQIAGENVQSKKANLREVVLCCTFGGSYLHLFPWIVRDKLEGWWSRVQFGRFLRGW